MKQIWSIAAKELRGYFNSAVAIIFLFTFLSAVLFTFFWAEDFFVRNLADVTPLFQWLPLLLIFLVAALTMRLWSEEQKTGTIEILLTLPVPIHRLVLGKFLAGLVLVAVALALTLGLPITVSMMGNLDWGPVFGGYVAALLLASAYLSIGLCISSTTDNQIVALIGTVVVCALLYVPGTELVAGLFGVKGSEILRLIGTGSRFESIARGVLDLRDLAYYAALVALFLTLNTVLLQAKRWSNSARMRPSRTNARVAVGLVALNAVALNLWLTPVTAARVDLTQDSDYSLSETTEKILDSLQEPLVVSGYFSDQTHPELAPLVPQLRNMLNEYKVVGGSKVQVEFTDPSKDDELVEELEKYGIKPMPLRSKSRYADSVVNAYFHILIAYGDQREVLTIDDLVSFEQTDIDKVRAYLDNTEYLITKNIRKVVYGFQSVDALFASLPGKIELEAYLTPSTLPEQLKALPSQLDTVAKELESESGGKFSYARIEPTTPEQQAELFQKYGIRPFATSMFDEEAQTFYLHILIKLGDRVEVVAVPKEPTEESMRRAVLTAVEKVAPGFTTVVGLVTPPPEIENPPMPGMQAPPPRPVQSFRMLTQTLGASYDVRTVDLNKGVVPDNIDVLILAGPQKLSNDAQKAVDQYLMRGGSVIVFAGRHRLDMKAIQASGSVTLETVTTGMDELLAAYGIEVSEGMIGDDERNAPFLMPRYRTVGGTRVQVVEPIDYPFFVRVSNEGMEEGGVITGGLGPMVVHWATPVKVTNNAGASGNGQGEGTRRKVSNLLVSSGNAWLQSEGVTEPNAQGQFTRPDNASTGDKPPYAMGVAITGTFESAFRKEAQKNTVDPLAEPTKPAEPAKDDAVTPVQPKEEPAVQEELPERLLERSPSDARLVVIGSSTFVDDAAFAISRQASEFELENNLKFVQNLVDWAVADTELLSIRARGSAARTLSDVDEDGRRNWEYMNYGIAVLGLGLVVVIARLRREAAIRRASRIILPTAVNSSQQKASKDNKEAA